jgi:CelD/BcsL family acetyltransferase involved in cellulose biosynthesis
VTVGGIALTKSPVSSVEVVTDSVRLRALADQWSALWSRSPGVGLFQSFEYCLDAWELVEEPRGHQLACVAGWRGDQLVAVWPFVTYRNRLWRHARQLVASGVELHEMLVDETLDRAEWVQQAWRALTAHSRPDVVDVSFFDESATAPVLRSLAAHAVETGDVASVSVKLRDEGDWDEFYNSLSKSYRKDFAKSRRRLEALGAFELAVCEAGDDRISSLVDWTLAQKRKWAEHTGKKGEWLYSDHYRAFLEHQLAARGKGARNVLLVLTLDGELLATQIGALSKGRFEAVIAGFNAEYDKFSPGARLNEAMIRWAWEQGADCDLGAGSEPYKTFWSRGQVVSITTRRMAVTWRGVGAFALRRAVQRVRRRRTSGTPGSGQR